MKKIKRLLAIFLALAMLLALAACGKGSSDAINSALSGEYNAPEGGISEQYLSMDPETPSAEPVEDEPNPEYLALFDGTRVSHTVDLPGMDVASFAMVDENGYITCRDFGYQGDQVLTSVETVYIPNLPANDEAYIDALDESAETAVAKCGDLECAKVTNSYVAADEYYVMRVVLTSLDQQENRRALFDLGLITSTANISLAMSSEALLEEGFIEK